MIGPYLLRDTMNAERYLQTLEDYVWRIVSGWKTSMNLFSRTMAHHHTLHWA